MSHASKTSTKNISAHLADTKSKSNWQHIAAGCIATKWRNTKPEAAPALANYIVEWQKQLWKFNTVGQMGRANGPKSWMEAVSPLVSQHDIRMKIPPPKNGNDVVFYLRADDAGDGNKNDFVVWQRPRFVAPGQPDLLLRDIGRLANTFVARHGKLADEAEHCLNAAAEVCVDPNQADLATLANKHKIDPDSLAGWLHYIGLHKIGPQKNEAKLGPHLQTKVEKSEGYDFIKGWTGDDALNISANSSDKPVRIPGLIKPHSISVHPASKHAAAVGWRSPAAATLRISAVVQTTNFECSNGVLWSLELRRGDMRLNLAAGNAHGAPEFPVGPLENISVLEGDVIALLIDPNNGHNPCDMTMIDLTVNDGSKEWNTRTRCLAEYSCQ